MHMPRVRFDPTINFGNILVAASMLLAGLMVVFNTGGNYIKIAEQVDRSRKEAEVYIPVINEMQRSNMIRDERIGNVATAIQEIRKDRSEMNAKLSDIRESLAAIKATRAIQ